MATARGINFFGFGGKLSCEVVLQVLHLLSEMSELVTHHAENFCHFNISCTIWNLAVFLRWLLCQLSHAPSIGSRTKRDHRILNLDETKPKIDA